MRQIELQVEEAIDRALSGIREARARVESLVIAVARAEEVARIEQLLLETGSGTQTDFLSAEADLLAIRADLVDGRHAEIAARVDLARVTGELKVHCERIASRCTLRLPRSLLRGKRARWKPYFFISVHFEDCFAMHRSHSLQLAAGSFNPAWLGRMFTTP
jgi:hypothetical protein